jgi:uncharacterized Zn finger protein
MKSFSRHWWGKKFIEALEVFTDSGRLSRGRSYARNGKIVSYEISRGKILAKVKGSINPFFDVYEEPLYHVKIEIEPISRSDWAKVISQISSRAGFISRLLLNEIPADIESVFKKLSLNLLPCKRSDFKTECSCPDNSNPCKHIAGVYYLVAEKFDQDPFLIFELRGLEKAELDKELSGSELGRMLLPGADTQDRVPEKSRSYYTEPLPAKSEKLSLREFWTGKKKLPVELDYISETVVSAPLVKKEGDYPPFWEKDVSFIRLMEDLYAKVKFKKF